MTDPLDLLLARALAGPVPWPEGLDSAAAADRAAFHGVSSLLAGAQPGWPAGLSDALRHEALLRAMWDMRHRSLLAPLLGDLAGAGIPVLLLKGTALAHDLYDPPALRARADTDLLLREADLPRARDLLAARGFAPHAAADPDGLQEAWTLDTPDGQRHEIDLHWQALNAPALSGLLPFDSAWARALPLPRLHPAARGLARDQALLLACAHRALHLVSPYSAAGETRAGDRLIWLCDIDRLARALGPAGWEAFGTAALRAGLGPVCLDGLRAARRALGTPLPAAIEPALARGDRDGTASRYLLSSGARGRALRDLAAVPGLRGKARTLLRRLLPAPAFMRARYPDLAHRPLPVLHLRRLAAFLRGGRRP